MSGWHKEQKMQQHEKTAFGQLVKDVMAYYRQDTSKFMLDTWWGACQNFEMEQIEVAMQRHATDAERGQFAPKVADMVRILAGTHTDRAQLAWGKTLEAMSSVGAYRDVVFDDPAIHAAVEDLGGWPKLCRGETKDLSYVQHAFCQAHKAYTGRGDFPYTRLLRGDRSPDSDYVQRGLPVPKPALVGDVEACRRVWTFGEKTGKVAIDFAGGVERATAKALELAA